MNLNIFSKKLCLNLALMGSVANLNATEDAAGYNKDLFTKILGNSCMLWFDGNQNEVMKKIIGGFTKDGVSAAIETILKDYGFVEVKDSNLSGHVGDIFSLGKAVFGVVKNNSKAEYSSGKVRAKLYAFTILVASIKSMLMEAIKTQGTNKVMKLIFGEDRSGTIKIMSGISTTVLNTVIFDPFLTAVATIIALKIMKEDDFEEFMDNKKNLDDVAKGSSALTKIVLRYFNVTSILSK